MLAVPLAPGPFFPTGNIIAVPRIERRTLFSPFPAIPQGMTYSRDTTAISELTGQPLNTWV